MIKKKTTCQQTNVYGKGNALKTFVRPQRYTFWWESLNVNKTFFYKTIPQGTSKYFLFMLAKKLRFKFYSYFKTAVLLQFSFWGFHTPLSFEFVFPQIFHEFFKMSTISTTWSKIYFHHNLNHPGWQVLKVLEKNINGMLNFLTTGKTQSADDDHSM